MRQGVSESVVHKVAHRYKENPFVDEMIIPKKDKRIKLSRLGRDNNVLLNQETGEVQGTLITTYRKVDSEQFVKLFTANISMIFDFTSAGNKAFGILLWAMQTQALGKDQVDMDMMQLDEFLEINKGRRPSIKISKPTFYRGIDELQKAQIIAKTMRQGRYWVNPNFVFNGDRIAFANVIERDKTEQLELSIEDASRKALEAPRIDDKGSSDTLTTPKRKKRL